MLLKGGTIMLTPRKIEIFTAIVQEFINTAEPVGSKTLIDKYNLRYSSATIRNEMQDLERVGLLEKTHTSSGRIPSSEGYRFYVEHIMESEDNTSVELALSSIFSDRRLSIDDAIRQSSEILAHMTNLTSVVLGPSGMKETLRRVQLIPLNDMSAMAVFVTDSGHAEHRIFDFDEKVDLNDIEKCTTILNDRLVGTPLSEVVDKMESLRPILSARLVQYEVLFEAFVGVFVKFAQDEVYFTGQSNMLHQPEFANVDKMRQLMSMLEDSQMWQELSQGHEHVQLKRSEVSELHWIDDMAVISSSFNTSDDEAHKLMVVGPSRMDYSRIVSLVEYVSGLIQEVYGKVGEDE